MKKNVSMNNINKNYIITITMNEWFNKTKIGIGMLKNICDNLIWIKLNMHIIKMYCKINNVVYKNNKNKWKAYADTQVGFNCTTIKMYSKLT